MTFGTIYVMYVIYVLNQKKFLMFQGLSSLFFKINNQSLAYLHNTHKNSILTEQRLYYIEVLDAQNY